MIKQYDYIITTKDINDKKDTIHIGSIGTVLEVKKDANGIIHYLLEFDNEIIISASEKEIRLYKKA